MLTFVTGHGFDTFEGFRSSQHHVVDHTSCYFSHRVAAIAAQYALPDMASVSNVGGQPRALKLPVLGKLVCNYPALCLFLQSAWLAIGPIILSNRTVVVPSAKHASCAVRVIVACTCIDFRTLQAAGRP